MFFKFYSALALGVLKDSDSIGLLIKKLTDKHYKIREAAAISLGLIGSDEAVSALNTLFTLERQLFVAGSRKIIRKVKQSDFLELGIQRTKRNNRNDFVPYSEEEISDHESYKRAKDLNWEVMGYFNFRSNCSFQVIKAVIDALLKLDSNLNIENYKRKQALDIMMVKGFCSEKLGNTSNDDFINKSLDRMKIELLSNKI